MKMNATKINHVMADGTRLHSIRGRRVTYTQHTAAAYRILKEMLQQRQEDQDERRCRA